MKTLKTALLSILAAFGMTGGLYAATTWSGTVSLDTDLSISDELVVESGAAVDLNGHSVTLNGKLTVQGAATITNSDTGDCKDATFNCSNNLEGQFQNLTFSGNLKLTVKGTAKTNGGFQGVNNTHTGGTVLDGYTGSNPPRFSTTTSFGKGTFILQNGTHIYWPSSAGQKSAESPYWSSIAASGTGTNRIQWDDKFLLPSDSKITVEEGSKLQLEQNRRGEVVVYDISESKGVLSLKFTGSNGNQRYELRGTGGMPNGTLEFGPNRVDHRWSGDYTSLTDATLEFGALRTSDEITSTNNAPAWVNTTDKGRITLKVGGIGTAETVDTFYGRLIRHNDRTKDWAVEKVGAGTWVLGGDNGYHGGTKLTAGAVKMTGVGALGDNTVTFNGGSLAFAADAQGPYANNLATADASTTAKFAADEGADVTLSGTVSGITGPIEKTGAGKVTLSSLVLRHEDANGTTVYSTGKTVTFAGSLGADELRLDAGNTLDLNGRNLAVRKVSQTTETVGSAVVTNSNDEVMSTFTSGVGNGKLANKWFVFGGNTRYVVTGSDGTHFRTANEKDGEGKEIANTHTGGTVFSNNTAQVRYYSPKNFGTGPIIFAGNSNVQLPSSDIDYSDISNPIEVWGADNKWNLQGFSWGPGLGYSGAWRGTGEIRVSNGFKPYINFTGSMKAFQGKLITHHSGERGVYLKHTDGMPDGTLRMESMAENTDGRSRVYLQPATAADVTFPIGSLETATNDPGDYTNAYVVCDNSGHTLTLQVGKAMDTATFAAGLREDNGTLALEKVGSGTWTLTGTNHTYTGATTVKAGTLLMNGSLSTSAVTVKNGATLGGTGTISSAVTVEDGGYLTGALTLSSVPSGSGQILVGATDTEFLTFSGAIDASTLTVKLTGELDTEIEYTILTAGSGSSGKATVVVDTPPTKGSWRTKWVDGEGDTKILKCHFVKPGFVLIFQ